MRFQELIYPQNQNSCIRNSDILNVNTSSDLCIFNEPTYAIIGADKIKTGTTSADTNVYIINGEEEIDFTFSLTGNGEDFTANSATFSFEIYKFNHDSNIFEKPSVYGGGPFDYSQVSAATGFSVSVPISELGLDGDYLIKGYHNYNTCTEFLGRLGKTQSTLGFNTGVEYSLYNEEYDYYFVALNAAQEPLFGTENSNLITLGAISVFSVSPEEDGQTEITISAPIGSSTSDIIVSLNGLVQSPDNDYTINLSGQIGDSNTITFNGTLLTTDVITIARVATSSDANLKTETIIASSPIPSGPTDGEGNGYVGVYFNTDTQRYEVYTENSHFLGSVPIVALNGVTLSNNNDYVLSPTNSNRIIFGGGLVTNDVITIIYNPLSDSFDEIFTSPFPIFWYIEDSPQTSDGYFSLELALDSDFQSIVSTTTIPHVVNQNGYVATIDVEGELNDIRYYRVCNNKKYEIVSGDIITDIAYSETFEIRIGYSINPY